MTLHTYPDVEQRSDEWLALRCGIVTASTIGKLISVGPPSAISVACPTCNARPESPCVSMTRKQPTEIKSLHDSRSIAAESRPPVYSVADNETSRGLNATLAAERITGRIEETPITSAMWRGIDAEPFARDLYSKQYGTEVTEVGFMVRHEDGWTLGYSPDGLVGDDGLMEIKAPSPKNHLTTILHDEVPAWHMAQCQAGLLVSGRNWIDFVSYAGDMTLYRKRVLPDPAWFQSITAACVAFEATVTEMVAAYQTATEGLPIAERIPNYGEIEAA